MSFDIVSLIKSSRLCCVGHVIHKGKEKWIRSFGWKIFGEESTLDAEAYVGRNSEWVLQKLVCESMHSVRLTLGMIRYPLALVPPH